MTFLYGTLSFNIAQLETVYMDSEEPKVYHNIYIK